MHIDVVILLAPEFEGGGVIYCLEHLRACGYRVLLVSLQSGLIYSKHGYAIKPDITLSELRKNQMLCNMILIPGGKNATTLLMNDPRVHQLLQQVNKHEGSLALFKTAESVISKFNSTKLFCPDRYILEKSTSRKQFSRAIAFQLILAS